MTPLIAGERCAQPAAPLAVLAHVVQDSGVGQHHAIGHANCSRGRGEFAEPVGIMPAGAPVGRAK